MLQEKKVKIDNVEYTVKELTIGAMLPLLPKMNDTSNHTAMQEAQLDMMKQCIYKGDQLLGETVTGLGLRAYLKLVQTAVEVNGLGSEGKDQS